MDFVPVYAGLASGVDDRPFDCGGAEASGTSTDPGSGDWWPGVRIFNIIHGSESADSHIDTLGTFSKGKQVMRKHIFPALTVAGLLAVSPTVAFAGGSDSPTPYEVTVEGVALPAGQVFPAHGHVNVRIDGVGYGIHFDPNNNHPGGQWIGASFIPWTAFGVDAGCASWVQISSFNEHYGEGGQSPICFGDETPEPEPAPEPTPEPEPEEPADETPETPEVEEPETPEAPEVETPEAPTSEPTTEQVVTPETTTIPTGGAIPIKAEPVTVG